MIYLDVIPFVVVTALTEQPVRYDVVNINFIQYWVRILRANNVSDGSIKYAEKATTDFTETRRKHNNLV